ncbi:MAG: hypothetical protein ACYC4L_07060 [Chloroflexota bacterium]
MAKITLADQSKKAPTMALAWQATLLSQAGGLLLAARCRLLGHRWETVLRTDAQTYHRCRRCGSLRVR